MGWLSSLGSALNSITGITSQQNKTYSQQMQATAYQNAYNNQMWRAQNEYNTPSAQLARMRDAGIEINPTSYALGTGNLSNTATFVGSENGFSGSGSPAGNPISMALGVANGIADIQNRNAYTKNIEAQTENLNNYIHGTGRSTYDPQITKVIEDAPKNLVKGTKKVFQAFDNATGLTDKVASFFSWMNSGRRELDRQKVEDFVARELSKKKK